ncbi:hypothetical protein PCASD_02626 [Puccinia coronata f. sp. avenae]|uniref:Calcineurin-like phosphoesterase domain-containing protein n=1 Tax=Puccinia coronata f. sp. avenae TaxID=200324 RepID=A0A2N5VBI2_9BASI|nr:hypothetical protein PCASD_02626 [Puccinia coronata f. sp. avenae]
MHHTELAEKSMEQVLAYSGSPVCLLQRWPHGLFHQFGLCHDHCVIHHILDIQPYWRAPPDRPNTGSSTIPAGRRLLILLVPLSLISLLWHAHHVSTCDGGLHKRSQPSSTQPLTAPTRPLEWGDLNIIHTTDSHGWLLGHLKPEQPEPNYSGDFGDFQSFVTRMKKKATQKGVDLLIVDSGDLHDGHGLSDADPFIHPGTPRGTTLSKIFIRVPYDILAIGNHELYDIAIAQNMHDNFAPYWKGSYLSSNVNITTSGTSVPIGSRYRKFTTEQGRKVTAFGIIFHFTGNANGTTVQPPAQMALEPWFKEAIREKPDLFLLAGHMGVRDPDWKVVMDTIRAIHPEVPVIILGGHYHVRDCKQWDDRSMALSSGRYMETVGWMSLSGLKEPGQKPKFTRRYLDANRLTYQFHAGEKFDTAEGIQTTHKLTAAAEELDIHRRLGVAPHSFYGYRVPSTSNMSLSYLFTGPDGVFETIIKNPKRHNPMLGIIHTTAMRADLYAGNFTSNDQFITMPFNNSFQYIPDVPRVTADKILGILNVGGPIRATPQSRRKRDLEAKEESPRGQDFHLGHDVSEHFLAWIRLQAEEYDHHHQTVLSERSLDAHSHSPTYGYVTQDLCPGYADDVIHKPLPVVDQAEYVATAITQESAKLIDVVFDSFTAKIVVAALNKALTTSTSSSGTDQTKKYTMADVQEYSTIKAYEVLGIYAKAKWNHEPASGGVE